MGPTSMFDVLSQAGSFSLRPADILVFVWDHGKPAALVVSPLTANIFNEAGMTAGAEAKTAEVRHTANGQIFIQLGWSRVPLAVESWCLGIEAHAGVLRPHIKQQVQDNI